MLIRDPRGEPLAAADAASAERLEPAVLDMLGFAGDPVGRADEALAQDPGLVLAHCLKAHAYAFALEPRFRAKALESVAAGEAAAEAAGASARERLHLAAARAWAGGEPARALSAFDALLEAHPRDLLGLMFAHQADFFGGGDPDALRARPARALEALAPDAPGRGFAQGMLAFGLEEAGDYARAEALGREAVARNPRDVWGIHAVAHVMEMQGRGEEGIAWYEEREADWGAEGGFFAVHNAWHLALHHLECEDAAAALAVYDRRLRPGRRSLVLNLCDAASLLWRLHLAGVDAGEARWAEVADGLAARALPGHHVFNDVHLAVALAGAGRLDELEALGRRLAGLALGSEGGGGEDYARRLRAVGLPAARAVLAFARARHGDAADLLAEALPRAAAMAGSHAQREVLSRTLVEAALRDRRGGLARGLLEAPLARKPRSPALARDLARCAAA